MREIKFRAWVDCPDIREVVTGKHKAFMHYEVDDIDFRYGNLYFGQGFHCPLKYVTLLQYTGLKDKNGKEIYEGDIIRIPNWHSEYKCEKCGYHPVSEGIGKVIWANESFRSGDRSSSLAQFRFETDIEDYELDDVETYEVIGNIYENPELLKGK